MVKTKNGEEKRSSKLWATNRTFLNLLDDAVIIVNKKGKIKIDLSDGRGREIRHPALTFFFGNDGQALSAQDFISELYDTCMLPDIFQSEDKLRQQWSIPSTRKALLQKLEQAGFSVDDLIEIQKIIDKHSQDCCFDFLV